MLSLGAKEERGHNVKKPLSLKTKIYHLLIKALNY